MIALVVGALLWGIVAVLVAVAAVARRRPASRPGCGKASSIFFA